MSRSGYTDDYDYDYDYDRWAMICWRGAVASAMRGRRGQAFLREMLAALDALPDRRLVAWELETHGERPEVCALGAVGRARGTVMAGVDPEDYRGVAGLLHIPRSLAQKVMWENDEGGGYWHSETPEQRWERMRAWVAGQIRDIGKNDDE